jgi:hypothetical protein
VVCHASTDSNEKVFRDYRFDSGFHPDGIACELGRKSRAVGQHQNLIEMRLDGRNLAINL